MKTETRNELIWHGFLMVAIFLTLWPIVFMISTSFKDLSQVFESTLNPLPWPITFDNYTTVLGNFPLFTYIWNTFLIAAIVTVSKTLTSILSAFAFVYYDFKYKESLFNGMLLTFFIPITVLVMPNYLMMSKLGLLNTPWGVALPCLVDGMGVFLMRQTMRCVPKALLEAAILDGAKPRQVLTKVILPLIKPALLANSILFFINSWNEYFWPLLILQDKDSYTLPLALQMFISAEGGSEWGIAMAVATLTSLPPLILYGFCQKFIINTFMSSGVKG
ncbi:MAG: carbohydrate ABC transporter permease [Phascolarctobacterium sp.]|jgi:sn-glycerol 3-phosphate transport system permease protein|nr:carbohydrate ABC transporter permease [Phascolarctobacterium sp.]MBQ2134523.1 carbohydrate ABC transporter permease [Phascolarctobacterium sp.]MBQ5600504.1 carbohydrate ABC transporter permease [Phascolarctobacterium sp.]MBQ5624657.1 carbohydrate ABC transporter permease [Phascolarctobacterium sp.]MBQ5673037.1 carbohydrate ABC transporter permease [Phascolarctobacterium sp.]